MIKLFAIDMDGTLLNDDLKINESSKKSINELHQAGIKTVLTSGRVAGSIASHTKLLSSSNPIVGNNGAIIKITDDIILNMHPLSDDDLLKLIEFANEHKIFFHFYDEETYYSNHLDIKRISHMSKDVDYGMNFDANINISNDPYEEIVNKRKHALKFQLNSVNDHPLGKDKIYELLKEKFNDTLYITSSGPTVFEIMDKGVNKAKALMELSDFLGIKKEEIAAIGDSYNDIPMIELASLKFAMGNASDALKEKSSYILSDNNKDAIKQACDIILEFNRNNFDV